MTVEKVVHPEHYNQHPSGVECIEIIRHFNCNVGIAMKHLWRAGLKPGESTITDLEKAVFYIQDEIERIKNPPGRKARALRPKAIPRAPYDPDLETFETDDFGPVVMVPKSNDEMRAAEGDNSLSARCDTAKLREAGCTLQSSTIKDTSTKVKAEHI